MIDQQKQNKRAELTRQQNQEATARDEKKQTRQLKQEVVARDEKKLIKKQSSKSRKGSKIAARSHDEIYNVQIIVVLQHQYDVDDVKCIGLFASYESCNDV